VAREERGDLLVEAGQAGPDPESLLRELATEGGRVSSRLSTDLGAGGAGGVSGRFRRISAPEAPP
jgi:hypothetical protein